MQKPIKYGYGIRILKQDLFEVLISFIVSANNNIKRIKMILFKLREKYGKDMEDYFAFPTRAQLLEASVEDFKNLGAGYRSDYLFKVLRQIDDNTLQDWNKFDTKTLREKLNISSSFARINLAFCTSSINPVLLNLSKVSDSFNESLATSIFSSNKGLNSISS